MSNIESADNDPLTLRLSITGMVQGVGYRAWIASNANALKLSGWVRNRRNGSVEALFSGARGRVTEMVRRCGIGPRGAVVDDVTIVEESGTEHRGFAILPTL